MSKVVNWGVLGAANFAKEHMAPAIHSAKGARLAGLATSSAKKAEGFQAYAPDVKIYGDYDALLADDTIDAVYIPLPNHLHVEWTQKAISAGKHVLCEKPIAMSAGEIDALIAARDEASVVATEAYMIVHHPQWQRAKALYQQGAIGDLIHVDGLFGYDNRADTGNIRNRPETGGGGIPDIGVYTYGSTRWLTEQEPVEITHADVDFENGVDVLARVSARFDGFSAHWVNSMRMHNVQQMTFVGSKGVMTLTAPFNAGVFDQAELTLSVGSTRTVERFTAVNQYVLQVEAFGRAVNEGAVFAWNLEDARGTQAVIDAVFEKARA
ncbi:MAG: Gfo/Idh/MocA family oxidoreductase [Pseudomonadota bacterium]